MDFTAPKAYQGLYLKVTPYWKADFIVMHSEVVALGTYRKIRAQG